jgi:hypothetical protein
MKCQIKLNGWWGKSSAYVADDCVLTDMKTKLLDKLISEKIITHIDDRNKVSHISLTTKNKPNDKTAYDKINNSFIDIIIKINKDYIEIPSGNSGIQDTHFTLCFYPNIGHNKEKIEKIMNEIIRELNEHHIRI